MRADAPRTVPRERTPRRFVALSAERTLGAAAESTRLRLNPPDGL
jgi:hypothetical protein